MKRILLLSMVFSFVFAFSSWAQRTVSGKVTDESGEGLPGVNVVIKGTTTGVTTDLDGNYQISVPDDNTVLVFSSVGMATQEVSVGARSVIDLGMSLDTKELSEIVVTAVGIERNPRDLSYSVTAVNSDDLNAARQDNVLGALQGRVPGAQINMGSGMPGSSQKVLLRGMSTITNGDGQPLIVVDGIPINNSQMGSFSGQTSLGDAGTFSEMTDAGNGLNAIEPENVESISVLKGLAASALYGSAAANGAIIITTKNGAKSGGVSQITFSSSYTMESVLKIPQVQTEFGLGQYGENVFFNNDQETWGEAYDGVPRPYSQIINDQQLWKPYSPNPSSLRNAFDRGHTFKNTISLMGGNDKSTFYMGYANTQQTGIVPYTGLVRNNFKITGTSKFDKVSIKGSVDYTNTKQDGTPQGFGGNADAGFYGNLLRTSSDLNTTEARDFTNPFYDIAGYFTPFNSNPFRAAATREDLTNWNRVNGLVEAGYDITDEINFLVRLGGDFSFRELEQYRPIEFAGAPNNINREGLIRVQNQNSEQINLDAITSYNTDLSSDITLSALVGLNVRDNKIETTTATQPQLGIAGFRSLNNGSSTPLVGQGYAQRRLIGLYSQVALGYQDAYHLELTARNDWSSTLPVDEQSFFYWSASANVIVSELMDMGPINYFKVKGAYASVGNDAQPYNTASIYNVNNPWIGYANVAAGNVVGNPILKPEKTKGYELGAEVSVLNERISLDFTYYNQLSEDQIQNVQVSSTTGYTSQVLNAGSIRNKGIEAALSGVIVEGDRFSADVQVNFTRNRNTVESIAEGLDEIVIGGLSSGGASINSVLQPGQPYGLWSYTSYEKDPDGNLVVDDDGRPILDVVNTEDGRNVQPDYILGFLGNVRYDRFKLSMNWQLQKGGTFFSASFWQWELPGKSLSTTYNYRHPWIVPGSVLDNGDGSYSPNTSNFVEDPNQYWNNRGLEDFLLDATYLKLRQVTLSYELPTNLLNKTPIKSLVVSAVGSNLFIWTPEENQYADPENSLGLGINSAPGFEYAPIPTFRSYGFSLRGTL